ncbi:MAG: cation:proton antiporter [Candidatus Omnitrophota bacterium]|jgi:Kef-type K+ transport system membrane component KefB
METTSLSNSELTRLFLLIGLLLASAHFWGYIFYKCKLPKVVGEIFGGFLFGKTVLGSWFPDIHRWLFYAFQEEGKLISVFYWLGLIMLMFISGFEIQKSFDREDKKIIIAISLGSTIIPFAAGFIAPLCFGISPFIGIKGNVLALQLIMGSAVAITAIPVISKIFLDLNIMRTRFAKIILTAATLHDVILWCVLAIATGLVSTQAAEPLNIASTVIITIAFFVLSLTVMPKIIKLSNSSKYNFFIKSSVSGYAFVICFIFVAVASILNVNIVFGAFLAGIVVGMMPDGRFAAERAHIKEIALSFFIPLYFAIVGSRIDLIHYFDIKLFLGFLLFATLFVMAGTLISARAVIRDWLSGINLAVAMNTRGAVGIVLATIALDSGIINETFFVSLVLVAIVSTLLTGYWLRYVLARGWQLIKAE